MMLESLLSSAVRLLLVSAVAWTALRILRVRNPHVEALVWRLMLLEGLALPVLVYWRLAPSFATSIELPVIAAAGARTLGVPAAASSGPGLTSGVLVSIYLIVALLLVVRLGAGLFAMRRISRAARSLPAPEDIRISTRVRSPATFGSVILLPADAEEWPVEKLDAVLAHERAHVSSRDGYWSWLAQLHASLFWFNPFAWWLQRRLETLAETTSDDAVVVARHDPVTYAALLLDFARHPNSRSVAMSVAESNVPERIERLLARMPPARALPRIASYAAFALLIPVVVFAASTTRAAPPAEIVAPTTPVTASRDVPPYRQDGVKMRAAADPDDFYPAAAKQQGVSGKVVVQVAVDAGGQPIDVWVVDVQPASPEYGFAAAAIEVARRSKFVNPRQEVSHMRIMVRFDSKK
jgi:TonB family protein